MKKKKIRFYKKAAPFFFVLLLLVLLPLNIYAEKGPFYFLEYTGLLMLCYLPLIGLAALIKLLLFKRKYSFNWKKGEPVIIKTLGEVFAELVFFLLFFLLLAPLISRLLLEKIAFIQGPVKNLPALKTIFTIFILLPLQCFFAAIINLVLVYSCWPEKLTKSAKDIRYGALLSLIFPLVLILFAAAGILLKRYVPVF